MTGLSKVASAAFLIVACSQAYSFSIPKGHFLLEGGGYYSSQGKSQFVNITDLVGNQFNVIDHNDINAIFGVGYLFDGMRRGNFGLDYGINAFYLAKTDVSGTIVQENLYTNLEYSYYVRHLPVYLFAKGFMNTNFKGLTLTADFGIGPNFMSTYDYQDRRLDGITVPDNAYRGHFSTTTLSEMAGVGLRFNVLNNYLLEVGYRFFNLGEGTFNPRTNRILNKLKTGDNTAQAIIVTISI